MDPKAGLLAGEWNPRWIRAKWKDLTGSGYASVPKVSESLFNPSDHVWQKFRAPSLESDLSSILSLLLTILGDLKQVTPFP